MESRYNDTTPVRCEDCGWQGRQMDCRHSYIPLLVDEGAEPWDFCPECGSDQLTPIEQEPATV